MHPGMTHQNKRILHIIFLFPLENQIVFDQEIPLDLRRWSPWKLLHYRELKNPKKQSSQSHLELKDLVQVLHLEMGLEKEIL